MPRLLHNEESVKEIAKNYNRVNDFKAGARGAFNYAERHKLMPIVTTHMNKSNRIWDFYSIAKEAKRYTTRHQFAKGSGGAYRAAIELNILDEVCEHMGPPQNCKKWDFESILKVAKQYKSRSEFKRNRNSVHKAACNLGIWEEIAKKAGFDQGRKRWNDIEIIKESIKHQSRTSMSRTASGAYQRIKQDKTLHHVCLSHMKTGPDPLYSSEEAAALSLPYSSVAQFEKYNVEAYYYCIKYQRDDVLSYLSKNGFKKIQALAKKFNSRSEFKAAHAFAYRKSKAMNWLNDHCAHMNYKTKGETPHIVTVSDIEYAAGQCTNLVEFKYNYRREYNAANRYKILKDVTLDLIKRQPSISIELKIANGYKIAKKYKSRRMLQKHEPEIFRLLQKHGELEKACVHIGFQNAPEWTIETAIEEMKKYENATEFRRHSPSALVYIKAFDQRTLTQYISAKRKARRIQKQRLLNKANTHYFLTDKIFKVPKKRFGFLGGKKQIRTQS